MFERDLWWIYKDKIYLLMTLTHSDRFIWLSELYLINNLVRRQLRDYMPVVYLIRYLSDIDVYLLIQRLTDWDFSYRAIWRELIVEFQRNYL